MADKIVLIKLDVQEAGAEAQIVSLNQKLSQLTEGEKEYELVLKKIAIQEDRLSKIQAKRATIQSNVLKETQKTTKVLNKQSDATGSATAATMELGRVISDAPYGIRGMANNISQLVSQLGSASLKAGGLTAALKLMWKALAGPLGVVLAITTVVSAFDFFYGGAKKAEDATKDFTDSLTELSTALSGNFISQGNINGKIEEYIKLIELKAKKEKLSAENSEKILDFQERIAEQEEKLVKNKKFADSFYKTDVLGNRVVSDYEQLKIAQNQVIGREKLINDLKAQRNAEVSKNLKLIQDVEEATKKLTAAEKGTLKSLKALKSEQEKKREAVSDTSKEYKKQTALIDELQKKIEAIEGIKKKASKSKKISPFKTPKELELDVKNNEDALLSFGKKLELQLLKNKEAEELNSAKTEEERDVIKKRYAKLALIAQIENERKVLLLKKTTEKAILQGKYDTFQKEAELRRLAYIDTIEKSDLSEEQKTAAIKKATADTLKLTSDAFKEQQAELGSDGVFETRWKATFAAFETLAEARLKLTNVSKIDKSNIDEDLERWKGYAEKAKAIISTITDFVDGEFNRQLTIEQNKTNVLNNELNKRLLDENLSKDEREKIQNEIAQNDEKLRLKQEKIEKKRFKMQKAANIATTLINTAVAAAGVMADAKGGFFARLSQAIPTIAFGLAQVATIARQKFQSSAGSSPALVGGGSSASSARAEPSFNIVGRSNENVLMSAIQSQFDQPLRAYVVARDVTNQQQLDGVISGAAST